MSYNIALIEPEIPMNTGNIGRLSLASGSNLHLVEPFGFELSDKRLKRAGLDYWPHINLFIYKNTEEFFAKNADRKMAFFSGRATQIYYSVPYEDEMFLVFGKESSGLPDSITGPNADRLYKIPIFSPHVRSLNLANAVSVAVYEGIKYL